MDSTLNFRNSRRTGNRKQRNESSYGQFMAKVKREEIMQREEGGSREGHSAEHLLLGTECPLDFWWVAQSLFSFNPNDNASLSPQVMFPPLKIGSTRAQIYCWKKKCQGPPGRPLSQLPCVLYSSSRRQVFSLLLLLRVSPPTLFLRAPLTPRLTVE